MKKTFKSIIIPLMEEFGYRLWIWKYPGSQKDLLRDWENRIAPLNFFDPSVGQFKGELVQTEDCEKFSELWESSPIACHVHEEDDSYLRIGEKFFYLISSEEE